jgi:lipopolysaccharide assembly protein A
MSFKIGLVAVLALIVLIFLAQNYDVVTVKFLLWDLSMSRAVLLFFSLLIGFIAGWILHSFLSYRKRKRESSDFKV